jgi:hypothetical protein
MRRVDPVAAESSPDGLDLVVDEGAVEVPFVTP